MKKKLNLTYVGELDVTNYGTYLGEQGLEKIVSNAMREDETGEKFLARVTLTIEHLEDGGLHVEAK